MPEQEGTTGGIFNSYLHKKGRWEEGLLFWAPLSEAKGWQGPWGEGGCALLSFLWRTVVPDNPLWETLMWSQLSIFR